MGHSPCGLGVGGGGQGVPLVYECCKLVGGTPCGFGVGVPLVWESCKMLGGTPCGLEVKGGCRGSIYV